MLKKIFIGTIISSIINFSYATEEGTPKKVEPQLTGKETKCIRVRHLDRTKVVDDQTIEFHMKNGTVWLNKMPLRCPGLRFEENFAYTARNGSLCDIETITTLRPVKSTCKLGKFQEIALPTKEKAEQDKS